MRIIPSLALPQTVTILNKLAKANSITGQDVWYKKTLRNCVWEVQSNAEQNGTQTNVGASIKVQIPSGINSNYMSYNEWIKSGNQVDNWTVSQNDWIVLGEVAEDVTANNIIQVMKLYEPNACKIQLFEDLTIPTGAISTSNKFLEQYASIYYVEGV